MLGLPMREAKNVQTEEVNSTVKALAEAEAKHRVELGNIAHRLCEILPPGSHLCVMTTVADEPRVAVVGYVPQENVKSVGMIHISRPSAFAMPSYTVHKKG